MMARSTADCWVEQTAAQMDAKLVVSSAAMTADMKAHLTADWSVEQTAVLRVAM